MDKLRWAFFLALAAGILTLVVSLIYNARLYTALYRSLVSAVVFALIGLIVGLALDRLLLKTNISDRSKGRTIDVKSENNTDPADSVGSAPESEFRPLTPDMVERVYRSS